MVSILVSLPLDYKLSLNVKLLLNYRLSQMLCSRFFKYCVLQQAAPDDRSGIDGRSEDISRSLGSVVSPIGYQMVSHEFDVLCSLGRNRFH